jgi:hypothetical protein
MSISLATQVGPAIPNGVEIVSSRHFRGWKARHVRVEPFSQGGQHATGATETRLSGYVRLLQNPLWGVCKREVRIQKTGV